MFLSILNPLYFIEELGNKGKDLLERYLGVREVVEAMDMDQLTNENVRKAVLAMRREVQTIPGIKYYKYTWDPAYKGVDDYLLSRRTMAL